MSTSDKDSTNSAPLLSKEVCRQKIEALAFQQQALVVVLARLRGLWIDKPHVALCLLQFGPVRGSLWE